VNAVAISFDSKFCISASQDNTIQIFDLHLKHELHTFRDAHDGKLLLFHISNYVGGVACVAISNDSKYLVSGSPKNINLWSLDKKILVYTLNQQGNFNYSTI
jgi:WD40 repeat protein